AGPRIIAWPDSPVQYRRWISRTHEYQVQFRIKGSGHPHLSACRAAAGRFGKPGRRSTVEDPLSLAGIRIDGLKLAGDIVEVTRYADHHVIPHNERCIRRPITLF